MKLVEALGHIPPLERAALWCALLIADENRDYSPIDNLTEKAQDRIGPLRDCLELLKANERTACEEAWK